MEVLFVDIPEIETEISHRGLSGLTQGSDMFDYFGTDRRGW